VLDDDGSDSSSRVHVVRHAWVPVAMSHCVRCLCGIQWGDHRAKASAVSTWNLAVVPTV
jgi:hypothetical protein